MTVTSEILKVAQMLQIKGMPSHASLISQIFLKNIHNVEGNPHVATLYKLVEFEESPFKISQQGSESLRKACEVMPNLAKYAPFIEKTLAIRILQRCKNFFTNVKFASLSKMMNFFGDWDKIEGLLYECNRLGLVMTIADHRQQVITFDRVAQVHENLVNFGNKLRMVFAKVQQAHTPDRERIRIFEKIKGELDEEMRRVKDVKEAMTATQQNLTRDREAEMKHWKDQRLKEEEERKVKFQQDQIKANQVRQVNEQLGRLKEKQQERALDVLRELTVRGIKSIGKDKISVLEQS